MAHESSHISGNQYKVPIDVNADIASVIAAHGLIDPVYLKGVLYFTLPGGEDIDDVEGTVFDANEEAPSEKEIEVQAVIRAGQEAIDKIKSNCRSLVDELFSYGYAFKLDLTGYIDNEGESVGVREYVEFADLVRDFLIDPVIASLAIKDAYSFSSDYTIKVKDNDLLYGEQRTGGEFNNPSYDDFNTIRLKFVEDIANYYDFIGADAGTETGAQDRKIQAVVDRINSSGVSAIKHLYATRTAAVSSLTRGLLAIETLLRSLQSTPAFLVSSAAIYTTTNQINQILATHEADFEAATTEIPQRWEEAMTPHNEFITEVEQSRLQLED